ncbi:MAG: chloride channel protein, partial [Pseudomonadales bacterium]
HRNIYNTCTQHPHHTAVFTLRRRRVRLILFYAVHLGAATSSLLGQLLKLPNNSIRVLIGCGSAAAIGASFNTPIAGVIFSMEVIVMEYTIAGFMPVILAAVTGTLIVQQFFGNDPVFDVPGVGLNSYWELPWVVIEGIVIAFLAAALIRIMMLSNRNAPKTFGLRLVLAGLVTASIGFLIPQILGIGYDSVDQALTGSIPLLMLVMICLAKIISTGANLGLGMPIGLIGPTLFIGAMAGGSFWQLAAFANQNVADPAFYVLLGMGAMMGAALQAPLAALMALLELTQNPEIVLPAMLCIVVASITASHGFGVRSIFTTQATLHGINLDRNPLSITLNRASVESLMSKQFARSGPTIEPSAVRALLQAEPVWILVEPEDQNRFLLRAADLREALKLNDMTPIDLREIPAERKDAARITWQATLDEAFDIISETGVQSLYVVRITAPLLEQPVGILLPEDIERYYRN